MINYLDVVTAQQNLLQNEQQLAVIHGQRLVASVLLVKALGGGWDASSLAIVQVKPQRRDIITTVNFARARASGSAGIRRRF